MDRISPEQRSRTMRAIHGKNTKPEMIVRRYLYANGFRYRVNVRSLPGTPDIVLRKYATVIFIHGCFWHGHSECQAGRTPKSNVDFWEKKIKRNKERDIEVRTKLKEAGWRTMIVWECQLRPKKREETLRDIVHLLDKTYLEIQGLKTKTTYHIDTELSIAAEDNVSYNINK